jgi:hypothetical protein
MLFYESAKCLHGRRGLFKGNIMLAYSFITSLWIEVFGILFTRYYESQISY